MPKKPRPHDAARRRQMARRREQQRGSSSKRGYNSPAWEATRQRVLLRDLYQCQHCGCDVIHTPGNAQVDHIVPRERGGSDDDSNLQTLCRNCHSRKTAIEDGGFGRAR